MMKNKTSESKYRKYAPRPSDVIYGSSYIPSLFFIPIGLAGMFIGDSICPLEPSNAKEHERSDDGTSMLLSAPFYLIGLISLSAGFISPLLGEIISEEVHGLENKLLGKRSEENVFERVINYSDINYKYNVEE